MRFMVAIAGLLLLALPLAAQNREQKVRDDKKKVEAEGFWIYNDLDKGLAEAKKSGKPMLVILRCLPCEECVKLDDDLVDRDPRVKPLLEKFVCVRIISTNGLDLSLFQYDYDQSFTAMMFNADKTIYGRYGTRSHRTHWSDDVSIEGLAKALSGALELHADFPKNKDILAAKRGPAPEFPSPEKYPFLRDRYKATLDYAGKVVPSCIHCHQVGDAQRHRFRSQGKPIPDTVLFGYPHPKILGLILDPRERATVLKVTEGSLAAKAGFMPGDRITRLGGKPLLSIADVQWVLQHTPDKGKVKAEVRRGDKAVDVTLDLPEGWRRQDDLTWRVTSWGLRRMSTGGMRLERATAEERKKANLPESGMAVRVQFVGQNGPHAAAKQAGFRVNDIIVSYDGRTDLDRETDIFAQGVTKRKPGDKVPVIVVRDGKRVELTLPMQE
jgi:hypothetical protein